MRCRGRAVHAMRGAARCMRCKGRCCACDARAVLYMRCRGSCRACDAEGGAVHAMLGAVQCMRCRGRCCACNAVGGAVHAKLGRCSACDEGGNNPSLCMRCRARRLLVGLSNCLQTYTICSSRAGATIVNRIDTTCCQVMMDVCTCTTRSAEG